MLISKRPAEAKDRANPRALGGRPIIGTDRSAIGTLVDRSTRFTVLVHLPREEGWGRAAPVKNGPALSGYGAFIDEQGTRDSIGEGPPNRCASR